MQLFVCHFHVELPALIIKLDTLLGKHEAFESKLDIFEIKTSYSHSKIEIIRIIFV